MRENFWKTVKIKDLTEEEWEALCDGCGVCCMEKLRNEENEVFYTSVACSLFNPEACRCKEYSHRSSLETGCLRISLDDSTLMKWLPATCAYRLLYEGKSLPKWHYLVCGDKEAVHKAGLSARRPVVLLSEKDDLDSVIIGELNEKIDGSLLKKVILQTGLIRFMDWLDKMENA